jgi:hypothetical protein
MLTRLLTRKGTLRKRSTDDAETEGYKKDGAVAVERFEIDGDRRKCGTSPYSPEGMQRIDHATLERYRSSANPRRYSARAVFE